MLTPRSILSRITNVVHSASPLNELIKIDLTPSEILERAEAGDEPGTPEDYEKVTVKEDPLPEVDEIEGEAPLTAGSAKFGVNGWYGPVPRISWGEVACNDGTPLPRAKRGQAVELGTAINNLRVHVARHFGVPVANVTFTANSWYRSPNYNRRIGGEWNSRHIIGDAVDGNFNVRVRRGGRMVTLRVLPSTVRRLAEKSPRFRSGGLGAYRTFTHFDTRGYRSRWYG